jgi:hypothetical protein
VFAVDFLDSAGLVSLCAAALDQFIFKSILGLTVFCTIGFLLTAVLSMAESVAHRHYKGFNWMRTKELLPLRIAIKACGGVLYLVTFIWDAVNDLKVWLNESAKRIFHRRERREALIPIAFDGWKTLGAWAIGSSGMDINTSRPDHLELEVVDDEERRDVDLQAELKTREEKEKNAASFWYQARNMEGVHLTMAITRAHLGVIR